MNTQSMTNWTLWPSVVVTVLITVASVQADPPFLSWDRIADLPDDQSNAGAAVADCGVILVGGNGPSGAVYTKTRVYDPASNPNPWSPGTDMNQARYAHGVEVIEGPAGQELYAVGGRGGSSLATAERSTPPCFGSWGPVASLPDSRGHGIMTAVCNNEPYTIGGWQEWGVFYDTNEKYDRAADSWIPLAPIPVAMQLGHTAVRGDKIYVFGGDAGITGGQRETLIYDTVANSWDSGADMPRHRAYSDHAAQFGDYIYLIAGRSKAIDVYDTVHDRWYPDFQQYPGDNWHIPAVAQGGNKVYVLGGQYDLPSELEAWVGSPLHGDLNGDGFVGQADLDMVLGRWGTWALPNHVTQDLQVTTDTDWMASQLLVTLTTGEVYQNAAGGTGPPNPALFDAEPGLEFDTHVDPANIAGGAIDLVGGPAPLVFDESGISITWYNTDTDDIGTMTVARVTLSADATGTWELLVSANGQDWLLVNDGTIDYGIMAPESAGSAMLGLDVTLDRATAADPSGDGFVSQPDLDLVLSNWGKGTPPPPSVPEPATFALLTVGGLAVMRRKRK